MWRAVAIVLAVLALLWALNQARDLVVMGIVACFLALAILPAVDGLVRRHNLSRGLATMLGGAHPGAAGGRPGTSPARTIRRSVR